MVVTFPTYAAAGKVLLKPYDVDKPAVRETHEAIGGGEGQDREG